VQEAWSSLKKQQEKKEKKDAIDFLAVCSLSKRLTRFY
jgi:hypothetical protein